MLSPELLFWLELILKMALTAAVVVIVSVTVERSGPFAGALIAALPSAAGAAYIILAIEHPPAFITASAVGSVAVGAVVAIFSVTYTLLAQRHGMLLSLSVSLAVWLAAAFALRSYAWTPLSAVAFNIAVYAVTIPLSWRYRASGAMRPFLRTKFDIPLRALAAAIVVAIVTTASYSIGAVASGIFALFPIILCSSIVILHPRVGGKATASMLAHGQIAFIGLALGFLTVHYLVGPIGVWLALSTGLLVSLAWSLMLWTMRARGKSNKT
jgi:uncharacterized membrane protein (GlpM family)